jgi:F-type H+-transporting ATPase subunit alpha
MPAEKEIMILFAAANGYLDELPEKTVSEYEGRMLENMDSRHPDLLKRIKESGDINDELGEQLIKALDGFKAEFKPSA